MKVILYNAISIDGFIARPDGDSDWVSAADMPYFKKEMARAGCILVGRKTYQQFEGELYPVPGVLNVVVTHNKKLLSAEDNVLFTTESPKQILSLLEDRGFNSVVLVGGGTLNATFLEQGLVDEIMIDVHPIVLGSGISLFQHAETLQQFERISVTEIEEGLTLIHYKKV